MGFDAVELVMEIEEEFGLHIPDPDAENLTTVGGLIRFVRERRPAPRLGVCPTSSTFYHLRRYFMNRLPVGRDDVAPSTRLEDLVPVESRRRVWDELRNAGFRMPPLWLPAHMAWAAVLGSARLSVALAAFFRAWEFLIAFPGLLTLAFLGMRPWVVLVAPDETMRDLVLHNLPVKARTGGLARWDDVEVGQRIRAIVAEQTGVAADSIHDDTRFIPDLT